jgi:hypothetical protein
MEIKKLNLLRLHNVITSLEGEKYSVKFSYFLAKNKVTMRDEIETLEEVSKVSEEFQAFENERIGLAQKHADKNEDGSPQIQNDNFVLNENVGLFQKEFGELIEQNRDVISKREKQLKEFNEILGQNTEFEGSKISVEDIPQNIEPVKIECFILADLIIEEDVIQINWEK